MRGRFITLEGGEGVGKSTQSRAIAAELRARGVDVVETREPGGTEGAEAIRALLMQGAQDRWTARTEALLFAAARSDHVARLIVPALETGQWVICDRYVDSSRAYQGGGGGIDDDALMHLHRIGSEGLLPDRTLLLTLPAAIANERLSARRSDEPDRMGEKPGAYQERMAERFLALANADPSRFRIIAAQGAADDVTARIMAALADLLP